MATIKEMLVKIQNLDIKEITYTLLSVNLSEKLTEMQQEQMLHGENSEDKAIGSYRSYLYAQEKFAMNDLAGMGIVDLKYTGDFHRGIFSDVTSDSIIFNSSDEKTSDLEQKYNKYGKIFGLNNTYKGIFNEKYLLPELIKTITAETGMQ